MYTKLIQFGVVLALGCAPMSAIAGARQLSIIAKGGDAKIPGALLIADRDNSRLLIVAPDKRILWQYRLARRPGGRGDDRGPDDAFLTPGGRSVITNEENNQTIEEIDIATRRIVWSYGHAGVARSGQGYLSTPDDAYRLPGGLTTVANIGDCRILFISPEGRRVRQYGRAGVCEHNPPRTFAAPNGDTPLPDGGMLVTEIGGSHAVRLDRRGHVLWDLPLPLTYPSDAQLLADGSVLVAGYTDPGVILRLAADGRVLWRYAVDRGPGRLNQPSLAIQLPNGYIAVNDDMDHRVVVIDPKTNEIVWQFGEDGVAGDGPSHLNTPDGIDFVPPEVVQRLER